MDLNPTTGRILAPEVRFLQQDCSQEWPLPEDCLDVVFTSNFFEHLPEKRALAATLTQAHRCLKPGARLIAMGPNIKFLPGAYWDFWDHHLPLTELSLAEGLQNHGFTIELNYARFLPYTMVRSLEYPLFFIRAYLAMPWIWRLLGKQFLVVGRCKKEGKSPSQAVKS
jgi:SAM-dependent methyltransferase